MTSIAFSALLIVLLLIPGAVCLRSYNTALRVRQSSRHIPTDELLFQGLVISLFLHVCSVCCIYFFLGKQIDFQFLYAILVGTEEKFPDNVMKPYFTEFGLYIVTVIVGAWVAAKVFRLIVHTFEWHLKLSILNNTNEWFEVFSGDYLEKSGIAGRQGNADLIMLDILCDQEVIYTGFLQNFLYSPHADKMEAVIMVHCTKTKFSHDGGKDSKRIPGDTMVIPWSNVKNFNVWYLSIQTDVTPQQTF